MKAFCGGGGIGGGVGGGREVEGVLVVGLNYGSSTELGDGGGFVGEGGEGFWQAEVCNMLVELVGVPGWWKCSFWREIEDKLNDAWLWFLEEHPDDKT